jgi:hypothetical protein
LAIASVIGPTTFRHSCNNRVMGVDEERIAQVESRMKEAARFKHILQSFHINILPRDSKNHLVMLGDKLR